MGYGGYSHVAHTELLKERGTSGQPVFTQHECHPLMNPRGVRVRESRDSADHPHSLAVVFALDVTGSMGGIPRALATDEMPRFMKILEDARVPDPQLLFMAIGDANSDAAPLQVGQFESTAELMDRWLTWSYLEGGGGPGIEESYELGLYFVAQHTEADCFVKRGKRGYLFMTGDEKPYPVVSRHTVETVIGDRLDEDLALPAVIAALSEEWHPFFLIPDDASRRARCERTWRDLLGDHVLLVPTTADICFVAAGALVITEGIVKDEAQLAATLSGAGLAHDRLGPVIQALRPLLDLRR